jgi:hypothetical protein
MNFKKFLFSLFLLGCISSKAQSVEPSENYFRQFAKFDTITFNFSEFANLALRSEKFSASLNLNSYGKFEMQLMPSSLVLDNSVIEGISGNGKITISSISDNHQWQGKIKGSGNGVRLNIYKDHLSGFIDTKAGYLWIETRNLNGVNKLLIYQSGDVISDSKSKFCNDDTYAPVMKKASSASTNLIDYGKFSCPIIKISAVATYGLFKRNKFDTIATINEVRDVFNLADGVYSKFLGIRLKICHEAIAFDTLKLYNYSVGTDVRISAFEKDVLLYKGTISPDIYHLFMESYPSSDGATGRGALGKICNNGSVSISMHDNVMNRKVLVICHEIGHNLNANHSDGDNCGNSNGSIMCGKAGATGLLFNAGEINVMKIFIANTLKNNPPTFCLNYPFEISNTNLCSKDTAEIKISRISDYYIDYMFENKLVSSNLTNLNLKTKQPGLYTIVYRTDTLNAVSCTFNKEIYIPTTNYLVTNTGETGLGSLKYAILNANACPGTDTIKFALPLSNNGIQLTSVLPPLIENCIVDGTSQQGYSAPQNQALYRPSVRLISKMPSSTYYNYGFLLGRNKYRIIGIEFTGFEAAISNELYGFNNTPYSYLTPPYYGNKGMLTQVYACKFIGNTMGIYQSMYDTTKNKDKVVIGDGTIKNANFFIGNRASALRIAYSDTALVQGNYIGVEPHIDTVSSLYSGIFLNTCLNSKITNNYVCNTTINGIATLSSGCLIQNNFIGLNPFNNNISGYAGNGIYANGNSLQNPCIIGDLNAKNGNRLYNQIKAVKSDLPILLIANSNVIACGNTSVSPDTATIGWYYPMRFKNHRIDSIISNCTNGQTKVYGSFQPLVAMDSCYLHFYAVPKGVAKNFEPAHRFTGLLKIATTDTFQRAFSVSLPGLNANEGLVFTVTSKNQFITSSLTNAVYPNKSSQLVALNRDTTICPGSTLSVSFNQAFNSFKINNNSVNNPATINMPGYYELSCIDNAGCKLGQNLTVLTQTNYLRAAYLKCPEIFSFDSVYKVSVVDYIEPIAWNTFKWTATNGFVDNTNKFSTPAAFNAETAGITYTITDKNKCTYAISKSLKHSLAIPDLVSRDVFSVYPNPTVTGIYNVNLPQASQITVYSQNGKIVYQNSLPKGNSTLSLEGIAAGVYYLKTANGLNYKLLKL